MTLQTSTGSASALFRPLYDEGYMRHELLASAGNMMRQPFVESATQDAVGPLICVNKVAQIATTYFHERKEDKMTLDTAKSKTEEAFQALAKSAIEKENSRKSVLSKNGDEAAVGTRRIEYEDNAKRVQLMVEAYESAKEGYDAFKAAQKDMIKQAAEYSPEQKKKHRNRKKGGTVVLKNIKDAIAGKTRGQYYLDLYDGDLFNMDFDQRGYGRFEITIVDDILGPVVRAPTTPTEEKIEAALTNLFQKFLKVEAKFILERKKLVI